MWPYISLAIFVIGLASSYCFYRLGSEVGKKQILALFMKAGYDQKTAAFRQENPELKHGGIVFLGDSITQDFPLETFFPGKNVINRGIGGDTSKGVLERLDISVHDLEPEAVIILIGTNDFAILDAKPGEIASRINLIVTLIKEKNPVTKIYLQAVYPVNPDINPQSVGKRKNKDINTLNHMLATIANVTWLDYSNRLSDVQGKLREECTYDGLHLNQEGYRIIADQLLGDIELLKE